LNQELLSSTINGKPIDFGTLAVGYTPVDLDTFAMDNSGTKKGWVGGVPTAAWTATALFAVYLGNLGICLELAFAPGCAHSASRVEYKL